MAGLHYSWPKQGHCASALTKQHCSTPTPDLIPFGFAQTEQKSDHPLWTPVTETNPRSLKRHYYFTLFALYLIKFGCSDPGAKTWCFKGQHRSVLYGIFKQYHMGGSAVVMNIIMIDDVVVRNQLRDDIQHHRATSGVSFFIYAAVLHSSKKRDNYIFNHDFIHKSLH